jgi:hypothetical protein
MVYDCFNEDLNTCPPFKIPAEGKRYLGMDFGPVNTAAIYFWEEPESGIWYAYREYLAGGRTGSQHAEAILDGEPGRPIAFGGAGSEDNWRLELRGGGLPIRKPLVAELKLGINITYASIKLRNIVFFDTLTETIAELKKYK